jgi:hypothetical protein
MYYDTVYLKFPTILLELFLPQELFCYDGQGTIPYLLYYTIVPYHAYVQSDMVSPHILAPSCLIRSCNDHLCLS